MELLREYEDNGTNCRYKVKNSSGYSVKHKEAYGEKERTEKLTDNKPTLLLLLERYYTKEHCNDTDCLSVISIGVMINLKNSSINR